MTDFTSPTPRQADSKAPTASRRKALTHLGALLAMASGAGVGASALAAPAESAASAASGLSLSRRPITLVVAGPAGGATDGIARLIAAHMGRTLGQDVVVDNKAGAGGVIGTRHVAQARPDGHTLLLGHIATNAIAPSVHKPRPYDPVKDFEAVGAIGTTVTVLVVPEKGPGTVDELLKPSAAGVPISYASTGIGGNSHLLGHMLAQATGLPLLHVPYRGSPPALQDLVGGRVSSMFATAGAIVPYLQAHKLRPLAVASATRSRFFAQLPTMKELGYGPVVQEGWFGVFASGGTPRAVVQQLNQHLNLALADASVRQGLEDLFVEVSPAAGPEAFGRFVRSEAERWGTVVAELGVTAQ